MEIIMKLKTEKKLDFDAEGKCSGCGYYLNDHRYESVPNEELTMKMICPKPGYVSEWD